MERTKEPRVIGNSAERKRRTVLPDSMYPFPQEMEVGSDVVDDADEVRGNANAVAHKSVFHRALAATKFSPREKRQTQIDGRGVQGIHGLGQLYAERFVAVKVAS